MMIDDELRNRQLADGFREHAEPLYVRDVEHDEDVGFLQGLGTGVAGIADVGAEHELVHLGPRRRIDDLRPDSKLTEQSGQRGLGSAAVAVGVDMSGYCDRAPRAELLRETLDRLPSLLGNA